MVLSTKCKLKLVVCPSVRVRINLLAAAPGGIVLLSTWAKERYIATDKTNKGALESPKISVVTYHFNGNFW